MQLHYTSTTLVCVSLALSPYSETRDRPLLHSVQSDSGVHPASCPVGTGVSFTIVIIIIIGKTALFEPQSSLEDSARLHPVFTL
jgi:hypothetical protein